MAVRKITRLKEIVMRVLTLSFSRLGSDPRVARQIRLRTYEVIVSGYGDLFEFVQVGIAIAIGPSREMSRPVKYYRIGVASTFPPRVQRDGNRSVGATKVGTATRVLRTPQRLN